ncbi:hypothetical protein K503DRAFT_785690 [Rhizopogon vinicolor AM-OR11-026]|uniref:Uncharacterized protein n=1 Tax=Rhizopogon vinicolor AM-OR11-026 TaxID=1314800 RepID=A0A1B7MPK5_9AGAM|nr:hypothetical protein K503DRAFT_785690 [Rhizopogon vinicolor AM-OR11-026]
MAFPSTSNNEPTADQGYQEVLGRGRRPKNTERMKALIQAEGEDDGHTAITEQLRRHYQDNYLASQASPITPQPTTAETLSGSPHKVNSAVRYKKQPMNSKDE